MEALKIILAELNKEFGGQAAAAAGTFSGQIVQLKNSLGDLGEIIGLNLMPALQPLIDRTKEWVKIHGEEVANKLADGLVTLTNVLIPVVNFMADHAKGILIFVGSIKGLMIATEIARAIMAMHAAFKAFMALEIIARLAAIAAGWLGVSTAATTAAAAQTAAGSAGMAGGVAGGAGGVKGALGKFGLIAGAGVAAYAGTDYLMKKTGLDKASRYDAETQRRQDKNAEMEKEYQRMKAEKEKGGNITISHLNVMPGSKAYADAAAAAALGGWM
jgi:hypothetical protein